MPAPNDYPPSRCLGRESSSWRGSSCARALPSCWKENESDAKLQNGKTVIDWVWKIWNLPAQVVFPGNMRRTSSFVNANSMQEHATRDGRDQDVGFSRLLANSGVDHPHAIHDNHRRTMRKHPILSYPTQDREPDGDNPQRVCHKLCDRVRRTYSSVHWGNPPRPPPRSKREAQHLGTQVILVDSSLVVDETTALQYCTQTLGLINS